MSIKKRTCDPSLKPAHWERNTRSALPDVASLQHTWFHHSPYEKCKTIYKTLQIDAGHLFKAKIFFYLVEGFTFFSSIFYIWWASLI